MRDNGLRLIEHGLLERPDGVRFEASWRLSQGGEKEPGYFVWVPWNQRTPASWVPSRRAAREWKPSPGA